MNETTSCGCTTKDGKYKNLYHTENEAQEVAKDCFDKRGVELEPYPCPEGHGWHLSQR